MEGLRKIQALCLLAILIALANRLWSYIDDTNLGDTWFRFRQNEGAGVDLLIFWILPIALAVFAASLYGRLFKDKQGTFMTGRVITVFLPMLLALLLYDQYRQSVFYPSPAIRRDLRWLARRAAKTRTASKY